MIAPGTFLGRAAAILVLLVLLAPVPLAGLWALASYRDGELERQELLERFDKLRGIAAYRAVQHSENAPADLAPFLLGQGTTAVISAGLQAKVREIAAQHGVEILQISDLKPDQVAELTAVGIRVEMTGPAQGIHALFDKIETSVPLLLTGNVAIRSGYGDGASPEIEPPVTAAIDISGIASPETSEAQP